MTRAANTPGHASDASAKRDSTLDIIRVLALFLMIAAHFGRVLPDENATVRAFKFVSELTPVFFFFAFGMTFDYYLAKPLSARADENLKLLALGIIHSLYRQGVPFTSEFFTFFVLSRVTLDIAVRTNKLGRWIVLVAAVAVALAWIAYPVPVYDGLAASNPGPFPIIPWILLVLAGYWYQKFRDKRATHLVAALCVVFGVVIWAITDVPPIKWPLTPTYVLLGCGGVGLFARFLDVMKVPSLGKELQLLSKYLLVATAVHYLVLRIIVGFHQGYLASRVTGGWVAVEYAGAAVVGFLLLILLMRCLLWACALAERLGIMERLEQLYPVIGLLAIVGYAWICASHLTLGWPLEKPVGLFLMIGLAVLLSRRRWASSTYAGVALQPVRITAQRAAS